MSRPHLFEVHDMVTGPFKGVGIIDGFEGAASKGEKEVTRVRHLPKRTVGKYHEKTLKAITFWQFAGFVHPDTGAYRIGKNSGWPILLSLGMAFLFIGIGIGMLFRSDGVDPWGFGPLIVGLGIIAVNYWGLRKNFKGKNA